VLPDGTYNVPNSMPYGTYSAIPGPKGSCAFYIYDNTGKLINSGSYTSVFDKPTADVNPLARVIPQRSSTHNEIFS
jgi:serine/threonine-protein kinase